MIPTFTSLDRLLKTGLTCAVVFLTTIQFSLANELKGGEWFVRLIAQAPADQLIDRGNVLGWMRNSKIGYDKHDLNELPPFGPAYLTIVFPHHNWQDRSGDYASDFRQRKPWREGDQWEFVVKSDIPRQVTLSWEGYEGIKRMYRMRLVDLESRRIIRAIKNKKLQTYTFTMTGTTHRFKWVYLARPAS